MYRRLVMLFSNIRTKVAGTIQYVQKVKQSNLLGWGLTAGILLVPVLAPMYGVKEIFEELADVLVFALVAGAIGLGGYKFLKADRVWGGVLFVIGLIIGLSLIVSGATNLNTENLLGESGYDLLVDLLNIGKGK